MDIVEALRNPLLVTDQRFELTQRAAAEIERLRAALKKIAELRYVEDANEPFDEALDIADAALEPKR